MGIYGGAVPTWHFIYGDGAVKQFEGPGASISYDSCGYGYNGTLMQVNEGFCGSDGIMHITSTNCQYGCNPDLDICYCGKDERSSCENGCNIELNVCN